MEPSRSSHSLYGTVNAMKARDILDRMLMVPPMTPTVSTLAPFGATNEVVFCAWAIFSRHVSTAAPSICLFTRIFVRRSGQNYSRAGWNAVRKLGGNDGKKTGEQT
jgi:hypothetical protein